LPRLQLVWADAAYGGSFPEWAKQTLGWTVELVKRREEQKGFAVQPHRWIVERTFSWFGGLRRLAKDFEAQVESSEALIYAGMIQLMARRLARAPA
jgi:putative transposase